MVSFNSGEPVPLTNDSHAERFFGEWYQKNRGSMGIVRVEIDINLSPCSRCAEYLQGLASTGVALELTYLDCYEKYSPKEKILYDNTTTKEDLAALRRFWTVIGPDPQWTNAMKKAEIEVGTRIFNEYGR